MQRAEITVKGKVQKVGYRDFVQDVARELGVAGFVENLRDGNVLVAAEAEKEILEKFITEINVKKDFIEVKDVSVDYREASGEFTVFEIKYGSTAEELGERMGAAILYLGDTNRRIDEGRLENKKGFETLAVKQDQMLGKQDQMLEKQDQMLGKQDMMLKNDDLMLDKQDQMLGKQDQMLDKQDQMLGKQDQMLDKQDQTIDSINRGFTRTDDNFKHLDSKYDVISQNMNNILVELVKVREESVKERKEFRKSIEKLVEAILASKESKPHPQKY